MKKFRVIETFTTAVITEIETGDININLDEDVIDGEQHLIDAHLAIVSKMNHRAYTEEIADNAGDSEFQIEEIKNE